jgi:hypothetical protein
MLPHKPKEIKSSSEVKNTPEKRVLRDIIPVSYESAKTDTVQAKQMGLLARAQLELKDLSENERRLDFSLERIRAGIISKDMIERLSDTAENTYDDRKEGYKQLISYVQELRGYLNKETSDVQTREISDIRARIVLRRTEHLVADMLSAPPYSAIDGSPPLLDISREFTRIKSEYDNTNLPSETQSSTGLTRDIAGLRIVSGNASRYKTLSDEKIDNNMMDIDA